MTTRRAVLAGRIRRELAEIDRSVEAVLRHWPRASSVGPDQDAFVDSVALNLHAFYSGIEQALEAIAIEIDEGLPRGAAWHAELLDQMSLDLGDLRPAVLTEAQTEFLGEYRRFRHRVRNVYASNLDPARIEPLTSELRARWRDIRSSLLEFVDFLDATADSGSGPAPGEAR